MRERFACNPEFICNELREVRVLAARGGGIWRGEGFRSRVRQTSSKAILNGRNQAWVLKKFIFFKTAKICEIEVSF